MKKLMLSVFFVFCFASTSLGVPAAPQMSYSLNGLNLTIDWSTVPYATHYTLYYAVYPYHEGDTIYSMNNGNSTTFSIDLWDGAAYYIAVTASDTDGESAYSNIESFVMTPSAPDAPVLSYETDGLSISLSWAETSEATGYKLHFASDTAPETFYSIDMSNVTNASYYLWEGAAYYLNITSYTASGVESEPSNTVFFVMGPPTPEWVDDDGDGFTEYQGDCNDSRFDISPSALEICGDGIDQDCSGGDAICGVEVIDAPMFQPSSGTFSHPRNITLTSEDTDAAIYYTTDGSTPTIDSNLYTSPLYLSTTQTIRAIAFKAGSGVSEVATGSFTFTIPAPRPIMTPAPGTFDVSQSIRLTAFAGATIYYTTDGSTPTEESNVYTEPLIVSSTQTIKAIAILDNIEDSAVAIGTYTITNQAFAPTFNPAPGIYYYPQNVSLSSASDGASILYSTNGTTPTSSYSSPVSVSTTKTIKAIAVKTGVSDSEVVSGAYTIRTVAGTWSIRMVNGPNNCNLDVGGSTNLGNVTVTQSGQVITVASPFGTETGTLAGNRIAWEMSLPASNGSMNFSLQATLSDDGNSLSGPVNLTYRQGIFSCSSSGTGYGTR